MVCELYHIIEATFAVEVKSGTISQCVKNCLNYRNLSRAESFIVIFKMKKQLRLFFSS